MYNKYFNTEEEVVRFNRTGNLLDNYKKIALKDYHTEKMTEDIVFDRMPTKEGCFMRDSKVYYFDAKNNVILNVKESLDELRDVKDGENDNTKFKYGFYLKDGIEYIVLKDIKPKKNIIEIPDEIEGKPVFYANISQRDDIEGKELIMGRNIMSTAYMQYVGRNLSKLIIPDNSITPIKELLSPIREFLSESMFKDNLIINDKRIIIENGFVLSNDRTKLYYVYPKDEVFIPNEVEEIYKEAFQLLKKRAKIHCPSSLKVYSVYADPRFDFNDKKIYDVPVDNLEVISAGIVKYIDNTIGINVREIENDAAVYLSDKDIICRSKNFVYQDGCVLSLDKKELVVCCIKPSAKTIILPSYITSIYKKALDDKYTYFVQESQKDLYKELKEKEYKVKTIKVSTEKISTKLEFEVKNNRCRIVNNIKADRVEVDLSLFDSTSKKKFFINDCCLKIKELVIPEGIDEVTISNSVFVAENPELEIIHLPSTVKLQSLFASLSNLNSLMLVIVNPNTKIKAVHQKLPFIIGCINDLKMRKYVSNELWYNDYDRPVEITYINNFDRSQLIITDNAYYYKHAKNGCKLLKIKPADSFVCPKKVGDIKVLSIAPYAFTNLKYKNYFIPEGINYTELFYRDQFGEEIIYTGVPNKNYPPRSSGSLSDKDAIESQEVKTTTLIINEINNEPKKTSIKKEKVKNEVVEEPIETTKPEEIVEESKQEPEVETPVEETKVEAVTTNNNATDLSDFIIEKNRLKKYVGTKSNVVIPGVITEIGASAFSGKKIESVVIPEGVIKIYSKAFYNCKKLINVTFPNSLLEIGNSAFEKCESLKDISFPSSLLEIGDNAFSWCDIREVTLPDSLTKLGYSKSYGNGHTFSCNKSFKKIFISKNVTNIGDHPFFICESLETIEVDSNNEIYDSRDNCNALIETKTNKLLQASINTIIPKTIKILGDYAFAYLPIERIEIPYGVKEIEDYCFSSCKKLKEVIIPSTVTKIGEEIFELIWHDEINVTIYATKEKMNIIPDGFNKNWIGEDVKVNIKWVLDNEVHEEVRYIPTVKESNIEDIEYERDDENFVISNNLIKKYKGNKKNLLLPDGLESIGSTAFLRCNSIVNVKIPDGYKDIRSRAFSECSNLKNIVYPSTIEKIGENAFERCDSYYIKEITASLKTISCYININPSVKVLSIPDGVEEIYEFIGEYEEVYLPDTLNNIESYSLNSKNLKKIIVDPENKKYDSRDNSNAVIETKTNKLIIGCSGTIIPGSVKTIGEGAFSGKNITRINIPDGVQKIEYIDCDYLKEINISKTVSNMDKAFGGKSLKTINISKDNPKYYSDDSCAVVTKDNNRLVYLCKNNPIPKQVKIIGDYSVACDLDCLEVPEGVEIIEDDAFRNCDTKKFVLPNTVKTIKGCPFPWNFGEKGTVTLLANKDEINIIPDGFSKKWIDLDRYNLEWQDRDEYKKSKASSNNSNINNKVTNVSASNKDSNNNSMKYYKIARGTDCTIITFYTDRVEDELILSKDGVLNTRYIKATNDKIYISKKRIIKIEHRDSESEEYYKLYDGYEDETDILKAIHPILLILYKKDSNTFDTVKKESNYFEKSKDLKFIINEIMNYYGKDNIKYVENNKKIKYIEKNNKKGCYIATCVYGSYDCKEVWRLRRYRDYYLDNHWFGRIFIKLYYYISPTLVKLFGNKKWFKKISKKLLDKKIAKLINKGYEDTPYNDKY